MKKLTVEQIFQKKKQAALLQIKNAKSFIVVRCPKTGNSVAVDFKLK